MATSVVSDPNVTRTRIHNPQSLLALRILWVALAITVVGLFFYAIPGHYRELRDGQRWAGGYAQVLTQLDIKPQVFASYFVLVQCIMLIAPTNFAILLFTQRSNDWLAMLVSSTAILMAAAAAPNLHQFNQTIGGVIFGLAVTGIYTILLIFPDGKFQPGWSRYSLGIFVPLFVLSGHWAAQAVGGTHALNNTQMTYVVISQSMSFLGVLAQIYRYRHVATAAQRQQTKWLILGTLFFIVVTVSFSMTQILPHLRVPLLMWRSSEYTVASFFLLLIAMPLLQISINLITVSFGVAVIRYRLWNIDIVVNRSLVYVVQAVMLAIIFGLWFFIVQLVLRVVMGMHNESAPAAISAVIAAGLFNTARRRARHIVDRYVFGLAFDLDELHKAHKEIPITRPGELSGHQLDDYQVLDVIGRGGMGEVYKGVGKDGKVVAIKTLLPAMAEDATMLARFRREAQSGMELISHPNIANVYGLGMVDQTPYFVMEYVEGDDLAKLLKKQRKLTAEQAEPIILQVCDALEEAHKHGYVHRDIKPSNIMIRPEGTTVLMDFGVAKVSDASIALTGTEAVGTITYMAPEQIVAARDVDYRADIYALGVVLYELLTGTPPFTGGTGEVLFAHIQQPPLDPSEIDETIPMDVADAILKALEKKPEDRFQSAGEFAAALAQS